MRHLVLGGGGFIGSHLVRRLVREGHDVWAADVTFPAYRNPLMKNATCRYVDLRVPDDVAELLGCFPPWDTVWQLAADMGGVLYFHSDHDWAAAVNNQLINANVMQSADAFSVKRVIFTSTACAFSTEIQKHDLNIPLTEDAAGWGTPDRLYGQEKRNSAFLWANAPMDTRVVFLHTVYGPYQEHSGIRMKFPMAVAQKARAARMTGRIEIIGDGKQVRTYMYIKDAIDRLMAVGQSEEDPGFLNIGGVTPYSCDEVADKAGYYACNDPDRCSPYLLDHVFGPTGVEYRTCDMSKFDKTFPGYQYKTLDFGMRKMIKWLDEVDD